MATTTLASPSGIRTTASLLAVAALGVSAFAVTSGWQESARAVVVVFALAIGAWTLTKIDDTVVALGACCVLVVSGAMHVDTFFSSLGDPTVWLLVGACMLAAGATASGLTARVAVRIMSGATTVRSLAHRTTIALALTSFAIPATSGRAALAVPVLQSVARRLPVPVQVAMSLLFPAVILLSAFASLLGAGAHLVAAGLIEQLTGVRIGFFHWMALAAPIGIATSHIAAELILWAFLSRSERTLEMTTAARALRDDHEAEHGTVMSMHERIALATLLAVIAGWATEPFHGLHPAIVAMIGGVVTVLPGIGTVAPKKALASVPWPLLTFLAATLALGGALIESGAADELADAAAGALHGATGIAVLLAILAISALAHLVVHSRSARATVLLPPLLTLAIAHGIDPIAAALASTAAAGLCLTLTASAKPVAMFASVDGVAPFRPSHLIALSAMITPILIGLVLIAAVWWWPLLGVPLSGS